MKAIAKATVAEMGYIDFSNSVHIERKLKVAVNLFESGVAFAFGECEMAFALTELETPMLFYFCNLILTLVTKTHKWYSKTQSYKRLY